MRVRHFRCVLMIALYIIVWSFSIADASDSVKWHSYEEGKALGKIEKKKVFLHFYADWCGFCAKMAKETFRNSEVVSYLNENFISIRVDFDKEAETAQKYGVMGLPTNWFLTEMGQPILNIPGYISADAMLAMLKEVNGISAAQ